MVNIVNLSLILINYKHDKNNQINKNNIHVEQFETKQFEEKQPNVEQNFPKPQPSPIKLDTDSGFVVLHFNPICIFT